MVRIGEPGGPVQTGGGKLGHELVDLGAVQQRRNLYGV